VLYIEQGNFAKEVLSP